MLVSSDMAVIVQFIVTFILLEFNKPTILFYILFYLSGSSKERPSLYDLIWQLNDINSQWRVIGLALGISKNDLGGLNGEPTEKLSEVINIWMTGGDQEHITWDTIISAIESPIVNNKWKANKIREYLGLAIKP